MLEIILSAIGGSVVSTTILFFLFKAFIEHRLKKDVISYQHELDRKKDRVLAEIDIETANAKLQVTNFRKKYIEALEAAYAAFCSTGILRQSFCSNLEGQDTSQSNPEARYFDMFRMNFDAFAKAFDCVSAAFKKIEDIAIYLDEDSETRVSEALSNILSLYRDWHAKLRAEYDKAQEQFGNQELNLQRGSFDFVEFIKQMRVSWIGISAPVRQSLKSDIRRLLQPEI